VAADRPEAIGPAILDFLARMEVTGQRAAPLLEGEGQLDEITYCIRGRGPPLVLLPLSLAPSQWSPLLPMLTERYCTITLSGPGVGFVSMLETRGRSGYLRVVQSVLDEVPLQPGDGILEVGCGSGALSRWLAHRTEKANPIVALDLNTYLLREAELLAANEGLSGIIEFREGNAERLPFPDNRFQATLAFTVLEEGPADRILAEMVRVTKPGGHIVIVVRSRDMPWLVNLALPAALRTKVEAPYLGSVAQDGCADKSLYQRVQKAGLIERQAMPQLASLSGPMGYHYLDRLEAGLSDEEALVWRAAMSQAEADQTLFIAQPFHCAVGRKPW
jgi:ubiquinone/menaquinone biosynthesis C-methylase UbiE